MQQSLNISSYLINTKFIQVYERNLEMLSISTAKLLYRLAFMYERRRSCVNAVARPLCALDMAFIYERLHSICHGWPAVVVACTASAGCLQ